MALQSRFFSLTGTFVNASVIPVSQMKARQPSVRVLTAALLGLLFVPIYAGADQTSPAPTLKVAMTAYNAVPEQTSDHPNVTASGAFSNPDIVVARSQDLASELPFGTVVEIDSATSSPTCGYGAVGSEIGLRVVADTMNAKWSNKIDVLLPQRTTTAAGKTVNPAIVLGLCKGVTIKVVGHVDISNMPQTQAQLAAALDSSADLAIAQ